MNLAILWLMKTCTFPMENTKQGAQSLWTKMQNAELNLKGVTDSYLCTPSTEENIRASFELTIRRFTALR